jgi:hypothetical protein
MTETPPSWAIRSSVSALGRLRPVSYTITVFLVTPMRTAKRPRREAEPLANGRDPGGKAVVQVRRVRVSGRLCGGRWGSRRLLIPPAQRMHELTTLEQHAAGAQQGVPTDPAMGLTGPFNQDFHCDADCGSGALDQAAGSVVLLKCLQ